MILRKGVKYQSAALTAETLTEWGNRSFALGGFVRRWQSDSAGIQSKFVLISGVIGAAPCSYPQTFLMASPWPCCTTTFLPLAVYLSFYWMFLQLASCVYHFIHMHVFVVTPCYVCRLWISPLSVAGSEASREGVKAGKRHSGGEGERHSADSAPAGLWQHGHQSEQRWTHTGEVQWSLQREIQSVQCIHNYNVAVNQTETWFEVFNVECFVCSGPVPALWENETYTVQTGKWYRGQRRGSGWAFFLFIC